MKTATPKEIGGAEVILYTSIDDRHIYNKSCAHKKNGELLGPAKWLAICKYEGDYGYYLFSGITDKEVMTDTLHDSLEEAIEQAEFEYKGCTKTFT